MTFPYPPNHPLGVVEKGPGSARQCVQPGTRWGALISRADEAGEAAHTPCTPAVAQAESKTGLTP